MLKTFISLLVVLFTSQLYCQKSIKVFTYDCEKNRDSNTDISDLKFKIISEHTIISQTTKHTYDFFRFSTPLKQVKIEYYNVFNQKIDTIVRITPKTEKINLCVERFIDVGNITSIEKSISEKISWNLEITDFSTYKLNYKILLVENSFILKYSEFISDWGKEFKLKSENEVVVPEDEIKKLIEFEKKLRLVNNGVKRCNPPTNYVLKIGNTQESFKDETFCSRMHRDYLNSLIKED